jgi:Polysaccharide pyruvyl transferase
MSNKPYYVLLTGGKNNAGDFLIKYRAKQLFASIRPDRDIVDIDAWRSRDNELLSVFNNAKAIILMGGPALRPKMYPEIYKALGDIDQITVPIITMAIGWRAFPGDWVQTHDYKFTEQSLKLLERIENSGYLSSVRDYHSLSVLLNHKFKSFRMTGCAALYDLDFIGKSYNDKPIKKVAFSLGVSFVNSKLHESNVKRLILALKKKYSDKVFEIVFHHSLNPEKFIVKMTSF